MNIILPEDVSLRIKDFISGEVDFPYIEENELTCLLYVYGKDHKVKTKNEVNEVFDLAERTFTDIIKEIEYHKSSKAKFDSEFIRSNYIRRELQVLQEQPISKPQIWNDPTILADSFTRHVSFYRQEYFFQVYGPLKAPELLIDIRDNLVDRIVMVGFNRKDQNLVPFQHPLIPVYVWFRDNIRYKRVSMH